MSQWISVTERLPVKADGAFYLAINSAGYVDKISRLSRCDQPADVAPIFTFTGWLDECGRSQATIGSVTHWMPLPPPPQDSTE